MVTTCPQGEREQYWVLCHWAFTVSLCAVFFFQSDFPKGTLISYQWTGDSSLFDDYSVYSTIVYLQSQYYFTVILKWNATDVMDPMLCISYHKPQKGLLTDSLHIPKPRSNTICIRKLLWLIRICIIRAAQNLQPQLFMGSKTVPVQFSFTALFKLLLPISPSVFQQIPLSDSEKRT